MTVSIRSEESSPHAKYVKRRRRERQVSVVALVIVMAAWLYGYTHSGSEIAPLVKNVLVGTERVVEQAGVYVAYGANADAPLGYAAVGQSPGYGGPVLMLVGVNQDDEIAGVQVVEQRETPGFFNWLRLDRFFEQFLGRGSTAPLTLGDGLDAVSGATLSSEGVALAIEQAVHTIHAVTTVEPVPVAFGWPELTLIGLFATGFVTSRSHNVGFKRWARLVMMAVGVLVLGFIFNKPLTLAHFTSFLSGYWPNWRTNLYWYLLLGGVVLATLVRGKNPYCSWFCPFGGVQECLGAISGATAYRPQRFYPRFKLFQRGLAFVAIVLGLALRQPTATSYEPFGTLFALSGGFFPWMFLVIMLFTSMVIRRPFCTYLCPLDPIIDLIGHVRSWMSPQWLPKNKRPHPERPVHS